MEKQEENALSSMVADFVLNAGESESFSALCRRLFDAQENGNVCLHLTAAERTVAAVSAMVSVAPDDSGLFILDGGKDLFYSRRSWRYEQSVRSRILAMAADCDIQAPVIPGDGEFATLKACQKEAVEIMMSRRFSILTGGPGTGKTYTIAKAVKLLQRQSGTPLRIALAAPTGKAAARVRETMTGSGLVEATTLHTLLEPDCDLVTFKRCASNPLELDWLIVDEAGMISLPLMAKLLDALPEQCRLTLSGDADQLSSVEAGRVFGDLCAMKQLQQCVARLTESTRFQAAKEIFTLAEAVKNGDGSRALEVLKNTSGRELFYHSVECAQEMYFRENILLCWQSFRQSRTPQEALETLNLCRVLCALRKGAYGTKRINGFMQKLFGAEGPLPVMVTRNEPSLGVSNGDVGVVMPGDPLRVHFLRDGHTEALPRMLLPSFETAFATTIHKSQGSEFDTVFIVLPPQKNLSAHALSFLTCELLYTAITRAKSRIFLFADDGTLLNCCRSRTQRCSGLTE